MAHSHDHAGHSHGEENLSDRQLILAVAINVLLTLAQIVGGILSGSLALIADALHNFSDAASLGLAWFARRIGRRPADKLMTFGYAQGEVVAALINLTTLLIIGFYLIVEAINRFAAPQPVEAEAPAAETAPEPVAEKVEEQPTEKPKPKRRGWWSLGS